MAHNATLVKRKGKYGVRYAGSKAIVWCPSLAKALAKLNQNKQPGQLNELRKEQRETHS